MQVNIAKTRQINHPLRNDAPIPNDDNCVGIDGGKLRSEFAVVLNALRLRDRQIEREC
jgi:hypothetical protein